MNGLSLQIGGQARREGFAGRLAIVFVLIVNVLGVALNSRVTRYVIFS